MQFISTPEYEMVMNIITIINTGTVIWRVLSPNFNETTIKTWVIAEICINYVMLLEAIGDILVAGPIKAFRYYWRIWPETICQILNVCATVSAVKAAGNFQLYNKSIKISEIIVFVRMLKLLTLVYEVKTMRVIIETIHNLLGPLNNLIIVMLSIFYYFAQLGMTLFGG